MRTATTNFERHGVYGVSVFAAIGMTVAELVARRPELGPERYKQLRTSTVDRVRTAGFALFSTLEWPHYDVVLPDYDVVLPDVDPSTRSRLIGCFDDPFVNPASGPSLK